MLSSARISRGTGKVGEDALTHSVKATSPTAPRPAATRGDTKPPPRPGARRPILDDEPEPPPPPPKPAFWSLKLPPARVWRRVAVLTLMLVTTGTAAYATVWEIRHYLDAARHTRVTAAFATALEEHMHKHQGEAHSFEEISFTDYIRRCLGAALSSLDSSQESRLDGLSGPTLLAELEGGCLRSKVADILRLPNKNEISESEEMSWKESLIRTFLVFARDHGYPFPPDLMTYERPPNF